MTCRLLATNREPWRDRPCRREGPSRSTTPPSAALRCWRGSTADKPHEKRGLDLYFLWSLERVGAPPAGQDGQGLGTPGAASSCWPGNRDGNWTDGGYWGANDILDTCFALLFLKQADLTGPDGQATTAQRQGAGGTP